MSQKLSDSTSTKPGEESYLDTAKKTVEDAVEYVEKTATGMVPTHEVEKTWQGLISTPNNRCLQQGG